MSGYTGLKPEQAALRRACWAQRLPADVAAEKCGCSVAALYRWLDLHGMPSTNDAGLIRSNGITDEIGAEVIRLKERGHSLSNIARIAGYSRNAIKRYLKDRGLY